MEIGHESLIALLRRQGYQRTDTAIDAGEFDQPSRRSAPGKDSNKVDGLGDQRARNRDDGFLNELFEAAQRTDARTGMDGADASGMTCAPGFEQIEGFGTADLTDRNAIRAKAQG